MTALTQPVDETGPVTGAKRTEGVNLVVTTSREHFEQCANPFCRTAIHSLNSGRWRRTRRRFCSDICKYDFHALKRIKPLLAKVGVIRFHELLDEFGKATASGAQSTENRQESTHNADEGVRSGQ